MSFVLAIAGSPRRNGNSETLLDRFLDGLTENGVRKEKIILSAMDIHPCRECHGCDETGACVLKDDMEGLYSLLDRAAGVVLASPIFFSGVSAQVKAMIDRCQCHWVRKYVLHQSPHPQKRPGIFICVRGQEGMEVFQSAAKPVKAMFATEDIACKQQLFVDRTDTKGAITHNRPILDSAYRMGLDFRPLPDPGE